MADGIQHEMPSNPQFSFIWKIFAEKLYFQPFVVSFTFLSQPFARGSLVCIQQWHIKWGGGRESGGVGPILIFQWNWGPHSLENVFFERGLPDLS